MTSGEKQHTLHMTVATTPAYVGDIDLSSEIRLLKTALMYADKVTFVSVVSSMLIQVLQEISAISIDELLSAMIPHLGGEKELAFESYRRLKQKKRKTKTELIILRRIQEQMTRGRKRLNEEIETMAAGAGLEQLVKPFESGVLDFVPFDITEDNWSENLVWQYFGQVCEAILSGDTFPLFDKMTNELVDSAVKMGTLQPSPLAVSQATHVTLSSELLKRLPSFDNASIDEVLDIRNELDGPLIRFRSAILGFSRDMRSASWDKNFPFEANQVFMEHVKPAILEIEDRCQSNSFLGKFLPSLVDRSLLPLGSSALGLLLANSTQLPELVTTGLGLAGGSATVALRAYQEFVGEQRLIENNGLFFYYGASKRLCKK